MSATDILARYAADVDAWHDDAVIRHGNVTTSPEVLAEFDAAWRELMELI